MIYGYEEGDDVNNPEVHRRCNPSFGITFTEKDFNQLYIEAKAAGPARFASWQRYHLNRFQTAITAWLPMDCWSECGIKTIKAADYEGRTSFPGVDLSSTTDLTACSLLFPDGAGGYDLLAWHWMPRGRVIEAEQRDRVPYREWAAQGYLELTEGNAIDQRLIFRRVQELHKRFPFFNRQIRLDDYNAPQFVQDLQADGFVPIPVSPKARGISAPSKELLRLVMECKINHGDNPLLNWQAAQCDVVEDTEGNIRPVKGKGEARKRIDGILASVYAISGAMLHTNQHENKPRESVYSSRGLFSI